MVLTSELAVAHHEPSDPRLMAAWARISELEAELQAARRSVADLTAALETNREIGAAIGIVMVTRGVESGTAFDLLRQASQVRHTKMRAVAQDVVATRRLVAPVATPHAGGRPLPGPSRHVQQEPENHHLRG